jgi:VIT1/CCC1 family predicted Fe2+/Mn2+ transporter
LTERQLLDYAITSAQNEQSYLNWASDVKIASDREIQLWETSYKKLEVAATQAFKTAESQKDREHAKNLQDMARKAQEEQRKAEARARNRMAKYQAAGTIVGVAAAAAVVAFVPGVGAAAAPGIIAAGASLGQAGGTTAAAQ